jgi:hypothetical protein
MPLPVRPPDWRNTARPSPSRRQPVSLSDCNTGKLFYPWRRRSHRGSRRFNSAMRFPPFGGDPWRKLLEPNSGRFNFFFLNFWMLRTFRGHWVVSSIPRSTTIDDERGTESSGREKIVGLSGGSFGAHQTQQNSSQVQYLCTVDLVLDRWLRILQKRKYKAQENSNLNTPQFWLSLESEGRATHII